MLSLDRSRLAVTERRVNSCPNVEMVGVMHALTDTQEFIRQLLAGGHGVSRLFTKPYSRNSDVVEAIRNMGVDLTALGAYTEIETGSTLRDALARARDTAEGKPVAVVDVGGYFARPLQEMTQREPELLPRAVVEVTTFGHNRYLRAVPEIGAPVASVARSPLKDVEAVFVGESTWLGLDQVLRNVGISAFGKKFGMVGYGMIGRRVANAALQGGAHTTVFDQNPIKLLDARSYRHQTRGSLAKLLEENDIVLASTGGTAIAYEMILNHAKDGIILGSAGSRVQEIDMKNLEANAIGKREIHKDLREYVLKNGKKIYILRNGTSINFLVGSCPDETMDIVFAEIISAVDMILNDQPKPGSIHEVSEERQKAIAREWLELQE